MWKNATGIIAGLMLCMPTAHAQFARQDFIPIPIEDMTEAGIPDWAKRQDRYGCRGAPSPENW